MMGIQLGRIYVLHSRLLVCAAWFRQSTPKPTHHTGQPRRETILGTRRRRKWKTNPTAATAMSPPLTTHLDDIHQRRVPSSSSSSSSMNSSTTLLRSHLDQPGFVKTRKRRKAWLEAKKKQRGRLMSNAMLAIRQSTNLQ